MSDQPRRKYPRRVQQPQEENERRQTIDTLRDISDSQFIPKLAFVETYTGTNGTVRMDDMGDKALSARRRKLAKPDRSSFGLQNQTLEGKKGTIKNFRPLASTVASQAENQPIGGESYPVIWQQLREATDMVFEGMTLSQPFETLYTKVEIAVANKFDQSIYQDLYELFKIHVAQWMHKVEAQSGAMDDSQFLKFVEVQWQDLCQKTKLIRCIFLVLDRTYCLNRAETYGIWDMGIYLCKQSLEQSENAEKKIFQGLLREVAKERSGDQVDRALLKNVMRMLAELSLYEGKFEESFVRDTKNLYRVESQEFIDNRPVPEYLRYVEKRLREEVDRIDNYLQISTRKKLLPAVEAELIEVHQKTMIAKGTDMMIDDKRIEDLTLMYSLLSRTTEGLPELCKAFREYIKKKGRVIVMNESEDKHMVQEMLSLKLKIDEVLHTCFRDDSSFKDVAREGFEHFINQRANRPAEMIAKYLDMRLKTGNKEATEEELDKLMDRLLILFRYIHGKDVFEAFYKKDLAKRLLLSLSASVDAEKLMLAKLKTECGGAFTSRLENMFRDIEISKDYNTGFQEHAANPKNTLKSSLDFTPMVLTQGIWPPYTPINVTLPPDMSAYLTSFQTYYTSNHNGRTLKWLANMGQCRVKANYSGIGAAKEFQVSQLQTVVLLLFNNVDEMSFKEVAQASGIEDEELKRVLGSLCTEKIKVLSKSGTAGHLSKDDVFTYNPQFKSKMYKVKINAIQAQETPEEQHKTEEGVLADRQYQIDAAIVRIMKMRKSLKHALLLSEIYKQLRFPVTPHDLKKRIESLIERDYMARDKEEQTQYNYVA